MKGEDKSERSNMGYRDTIDSGFTRYCLHHLGICLKLDI